MMRSDEDELAFSADEERAVLAAIATIGTLEWRREPPRVSILESTPVAFGEFEGGDPQIQLLNDGRSAQLLQPIGYVGPEPDKQPWPVPAGITLDGASIPRPLWSLIGGPFEGRYRNASIVHDHYCVIKTRAWKATHRMFHLAMLCSGVSTFKAKVMFYAVYRFGPRWPDPAALAGQLEGTTEAFKPATPLTAIKAQALANDAEAIYLNDLSLDEIEALADARDASRASVEEGTLEGTGTPVDSTALARLLSIPGGSGRGDDLEVIIARAALLPDYVLSRFERKGARIVACRKSVTDFERSLKGVVPRGWERTGKTWDDVPGAYLPARNCVVIATADGANGRVVPDKTSGKHGSVDLLVHESLHGYDFVSGHAVLSEQSFVDARTADFESLDPYEQQAGEAGLQETFAESGARFFTDGEAMAADWPGLFRYWMETPPDVQNVSRLESTASADDAIGTGKIEDDGSIALDLRAEGPDGAIGHAQFTIDVGSAHYEALKTHLFGSTLESTEAEARGVVLFRP